MKKSRLLGAVCACVFSFVSTSSHATLIPVLGGQAYYDDVADLSWLADANAAVGSVYDTYNPGTGRMNWYDANAWAANLDIDGVTGWRLPTTLQPDPSCGGQYGGVSSFDYNCTGSELGNLYYNVLGNTPYSFTNPGPFSNVQSLHYWSSTEYALDPTSAWWFNFGEGRQDNLIKVDALNAWAVHSGNVGAVPVPAAVWLFGIGLLGLIGVARKKTA